MYNFCYRSARDSEKEPIKYTDYWRIQRDGLMLWELHVPP